MKKQKVQIKDLKRNHIRQHLKIVHPFLNREFRKLKATELDSKKVFTELFGSEKFAAYKLRAIFEYQM